MCFQTQKRGASRPSLPPSVSINPPFTPKERRIIQLTILAFLFLLRFLYASEERYFDRVQAQNQAARKGVPHEN